MKVIINGQDSGKRVKDMVELLALVLHYYLYSEEKIIITLEE